MKKKSIIMLLCALVVMSSVAFGTIAYLTDRESVTNTFTMGDVDIIVDETEIDEETGEPVPSDPEDDDPEDDDDDYKRTEEGNEYDIVPGGEYIKDPTLTVKEGSKESYVRMVVTITKADELDKIFEELAIMYPDTFDGAFLPETCVTGWNPNNWPCYSMTKDTENNAYVLEFRYPNVVKGLDGEDVKLPALFETIKVPAEITTAQMQTINGLTIDVEGHAMQVTGFENDPAAAWAAFDAQVVAEDNLAAATQPEAGAETETEGE